MREIIYGMTNGWTYTRTLILTKNLILSFNLTASAIQTFSLEIQSDMTVS